MSTSSSTPGTARSRAGWLAGQAPQADPGAAAVIPRGHGRTINVGGIPGELLLDPAECDGDLEVHGQDVAPGQLIRAHVHADAAQWSVVTLGTLVFRIGSQTIERRAGEFAYRPAGVVHAVLNRTPEPARHVEGNMPGDGMLRYYERYAELAAGGPPDPEEVAGLAAAYGLFFDDGLTAELERAYHVSAAAPSGGGPRP